MRIARLLVVSLFLTVAPLTLAQSNWTDPAGNITSLTNGTVGVGTSSPSARLTVSGSGGFNTFGSAQFNLRNSVSGAVFGQQVTDSGLWQLFDSVGSATKILVAGGTNGAINFYTGSGNTIFNGTGRVGIGAAPLKQFSVGNGATGAIQTTEIGNYAGDTVGNILFSYNTANVDFTQSHPSTGVFRWLYGASEKMQLDRNGTLHMVRTDPAAGLNMVGFYEVVAGTQELFGYLNQRGTGHATEARQFNIGNANATGSVAIWTANVQRMTVSSSGNVGIGTAPSATHRISVAGDAHFTGKVTGGNIVAKYQDIAEWVPATEQLAAGTVVVLDPERPNHVITSSVPYDTSVAGVVSAQPGLLLGEEDGSKAMIATTGRVRVRVDATERPIRIGDLLATSSVPGTAMRSEPMDINGRRFHQPGTIIGKALEPLSGGVGEILVLLSMQ